MDISLNIETLIQQRTNLIKQLDKLSNEDLEFIPEGSNNNILWNLGHILVVPQYYFYVANGIPQSVELFYIHNYMTGTHPRANDVRKEFEIIKRHLLMALNELRLDYDKGLFKKFIAFGKLDFEGILELLIKHETNHLEKINSILKINKN